MHIKIHIPPTRKAQERGWEVPVLKKAEKSYTVPMADLVLREETHIFKKDERINGEYVAVDSEMQRYWVSAPCLKVEWAEVHAAEYGRISNAFAKLNLAAIEVHNAQARRECPLDRGKQFMKADMNALFGLDISAELDDV